MYERPFGPRAPWNIPVSGLRVHPESDRYSRMHWEESPDKPGNFNCSFTSYTYPVYTATSSTPKYQVVSKNPSWGNIHGKQIPFDPSWKAAAGSDAQIIVLDPSTGKEYDLWQASLSGGKVRVSNGSIVPGHYMTYEGGNKPSRGVGIQYLAMLVRPQEVEQGEIRHALSMPIKSPDGYVSVPPATKVEGNSKRRNGVPEGMRFALNVSDQEIDAWASKLPMSAQGKRSAKIVAVALRDYGWFITDTAGGAHFQFESVNTAGSHWKRLGFEAKKSGGKDYPRDMLDGLLRKERIYAIVPSDQY